MFIFVVAAKHFVFIFVVATKHFVFIFGVATKHFVFFLVVATKHSVFISVVATKHCCCCHTIFFDSHLLLCYAVKCNVANAGAYRRVAATMQRNHRVPVPNYANIGWPSDLSMQPGTESCNTRKQTAPYHTSYTRCWRTSRKEVHGSKTKSNANQQLLTLVVCLYRCVCKIFSHLVSCFTICRYTKSWMKSSTIVRGLFRHQHF